MQDSTSQDFGYSINANPGLPMTPLSPRTRRNLAALARWRADDPRSSHPSGDTGRVHGPETDPLDAPDAITLREQWQAAMVARARR